MRRVFAMPLLVVGCLACTKALAQDSAWIETAYYAFETFKSVSNGAAGSQVFVQKSYGEPARALDAGTPVGVPISALSIDGTDVYFVSAVSWRLNDQLVTPRDVVKIADSGTSTVHVLGSVLGLQANTRIATISVRGNEMLFSLDIHADLSGLMVRPSDILGWDGGAVSKVYAADDMGVPHSTKLVAMERTATGSLLMGFSSGTEISGIRAMPGDLLEYKPALLQWSRARSRNQLGVNCSPCDLKAVAADTSATVIFRNDLESF